MRRFLQTWGLLIFWCLVIAVESTDLGSGAHTGSLLAGIFRSFGATPPPWLPELNYTLRKLGHFGGYAFVSHAWFHGFSRTWSRPAWVHAVWAVVATAAVASLDEFHQLFIPSRGASIRDVLLDTFGAVVMQAFVLLMVGWMGVRRSARESRSAISAPVLK